MELTRLRAEPAAPVTIYYCKAGIPTGQTVRILHRKEKITCRGVSLHAVTGEMIHGNSSGPAKASGARCVLTVTSGQVTIHP